MCVLRANIVTNCKKCKSSIRPRCTIKRRGAKKTYVDNKTTKKKT